MALIGAILACGALGGLASAKARKLTLVSAFILFVASFIWIFHGGDLGSVAALGRGEEATSTSSTLTGRVPLWNDELTYVRVRPILGYGYNAFLNGRNLAAISESIGWAPASEHSGYLGTLLELGYMGEAAFVLVIALGIKRSFDLAKNGPQATFAAAVMVWLCCNLFLESGVIRDPAFAPFTSMVILAFLSFKRECQTRWLIFPSPVWLSLCSISPDASRGIWQHLNRRCA